MSFHVDPSFSSLEGGASAAVALELCATCLTRGRKMFAVGVLAEVFTLLASTPTVPLTTAAAAEAIVCWECHRLLRRIDKFRTRVVSVGILLQSVDICSEYKTNDYSLSSLRSYGKIGEDFILQQGEELQRNNEVRLVEHRQASELKRETERARSVDEHWGSSEEGAARPRRSRRPVRRTARIQHMDDYTEEHIEGPAKSKAERASKKKGRSERVMGEKVVAITMTEAEMQRARDEMRASHAYRAHAYQCSGCIEGFSSDALLQRHDRTSHGDEAGTYRCDICGVRAHTEERLAAHRRAHYTLYACMCGFTLRSLRAVMCHYRSQHAHTKYECKACGKEFPSDRSLRYHRECVHREAHKCQYCGKLFNNASTFKRHLLQHTGMPMFPCSVCNKSYRGTFGLHAHMRTHATSAPDDAFCAECNVQYKSKYLYRHHLRSSPRHAAPDNFRFPCPHCDKRFFVKSQLKIHEDSVHLKKGAFKCDHCGKAFSLIYRLKNHIKSVHGHTPPAKTHICETCGRAFATKQQVLRHQPLHTGERAFRCRLCSATFRQSAALYTHNKLVHLQTGNTK